MPAHIGKKMTKTFSSLLLATLAIFAISCNKEGEGGTGTIQGKIYKVNHPDDEYSLAADTIPGAKEDVFIVYGDDTFYGDDTEAGDDGTYRFRYLTPGEYTIYAYSELATGEKVAEKRTVTLKRGQTLDVEDIYIHRGKAYGTSMIRGRVSATYFDKNGDIVTTNAYEHRVYVKRLNDTYHIDDTRVGADGYYYFQKLLPDTYVVYTFGENADEVPYLVSDTVTVSATGEIYDAATLSIRLKA